MNRPDPNASRIKDIFKETFSGEYARKVDDLEELKSQGALLFTPEEIYETRWSIDCILRKLCVDNNITEAYFAEKYKLYALRELGMHPTQASNNRSNLMKALKAGRITYKRFVEVACNVLGFKVENCSFTLVDPKGSKQVLEFSESKE